MTKAEIIEDIVQKTGIARKDVATTVEAFMESVKDCMLEKKENVYLRGFGTFVVKHRAEIVERLLIISLDVSHIDMLVVARCQHYKREKINEVLHKNPLCFKKVHSTVSAIKLKAERATIAQAQ